VKGKHWMEALGASRMVRAHNPALWAYPGWLTGDSMVSPAALNRQGRGLAGAQRKVWGAW
jgi:hypothetical protein